MGHHWLLLQSEWHTKGSTTIQNLDCQMAPWWELCLHQWMCNHMLGDLEMQEQSLLWQKTIIKSPCEIIIYACSFLSYWVGLYNEATQERILEGVQKLMACAHKVLHQPWGCYHPPGGRTRWRRRWMIGWLRLSWWFCTSVMLYCVVLGFWDILYAFVGDFDLEILGQTFLEF